MRVLEPMWQLFRIVHSKISDRNQMQRLLVVQDGLNHHLMVALGTVNGALTLF